MFYILGSPVDGPCRRGMCIPAHTDWLQRRTSPKLYQDTAVIRDSRSSLLGSGKTEVMESPSEVQDTSRDDSKN